MNDSTILRNLEDLAFRLNIKVRYDPLKIDGSFHAGGLCRVRGEDVLIINKKSSSREKIQILIDVLRRRELGDIYVMPSLREMLDDQDGP